MKLKRILTALAVTAICVMPITVHSAEFSDGSQFISEEAIEMEAIEIEAPFEDEAAETKQVGTTSGKCGDNVYWTLSNGVLNITGTGDMYNWTYSTHLWDYLTEIRSVVIADGVTSIGDYAFFSSWHLTDITMPDSITRIGQNAFSQCMSLKNIRMSKNITSIGFGAFLRCGITSIELPNGITSIENSTFSDCSYLTSIKLPEHLTNIGASAFYGCDKI